MLYLSKKDIERIGIEVLADFYQTMPEGWASVNIEGLATEYLGLNPQYQRLSDTGQILGLTTFQSIQLELKIRGKDETITVPQDTVLLDDSLRPIYCRGRRRFTLAHECSHQILYRLEEAQLGHSRRGSVVAGQTYSCRQLHTASDWEEWQANALGAVLLMPEPLVRCGYARWWGRRKIQLTDRGIAREDYIGARYLAQDLCVSTNALLIRLRELGLVETHSQQGGICARAS
ncbi:MAG: ImmA/IrrE family metallo-endopeptidase [Oscillospiraceae bacterium]|jgi:hypothetical protein|nr:ImmA/IrrE family metallo-endopeptidase [Oscillospiraceae bacterium]